MSNLLPKSARPVAINPQQHGHSPARLLLYTLLNGTVADAVEDHQQLNSVAALRLGLQGRTRCRRSLPRGDELGLNVGGDVGGRAVLPCHVVVVVIRDVAVQREAEL